MHKDSQAWEGFEHPGAQSASQTNHVSIFEASSLELVFLKASRSASQTLAGSIYHPRILLKCRFWSRRSEAGILHF